MHIFRRCCVLARFHFLSRLKTSDTYLGEIYILNLNLVVKEESMKEFRNQIKQDYNFLDIAFLSHL